MPDKCDELEKMIDTSLKIFYDSVVSSKHPSKIAQHSGITLNKQEMNELVTRITQKTQILAKSKMSDLLKENKLRERFTQLEELTESSENLNKKLNRPYGYKFIKPKIDVRLHIARTTSQKMNDVDQEIENLEREIEKEKNELARRESIMSKLLQVVDSQQQTLKFSV